MTNKTLLFDLDGTLIDSSSGLLNTLQWVIEKAGYDLTDYQCFKSQISFGAKALLTAAAQTLNVPYQSHWLTDFYTHYEAHCHEFIHAFKGVNDLLHWCESSGYRWGIVTNKRTPLTQVTLEALGWASRAQVVVCGDTYAHAKPHPEPLQRAMSALGSTPKNSLFIGDSIVDVQTALAAKVPMLLVTYGYADETLLEQCPAEIPLADTPQAIQQYLASTC